MQQADRRSFDSCNATRYPLEVPDGDRVAISHCLLHLCRDDLARRRSVSPDHFRRLSICLADVVEIPLELVKHGVGLARP